MINKYIIAKLNPCADRFDNFVKFYGDKSFTKQQFMGLKNITHEDKLWAAFRLMPKENLRFAAADIAESVLHIFEKKYPGDLRPRQAIEAARAKDATNSSSRAASAASNAAYAAYTAAAYDAAHAAYAAYTAAAYDAAHAAYAAYAAYDATHDAAHAAYAAYAACAASAADAYDAYAAGVIDPEKLIRKIMLKYWKDKK